VVNVAIAISTMLGTGGSTIISKYLGEGKKERAREALTQFVVLALVLSFVLLIISEIFLTPISRFLGASDILLADCRMYLGTAMLFAPACMLQAVFQSFLVTAGRPGLGLALMIGAGISNMVLDYVLIVPCQMGIAGAALATGIGQCIPAVCGLCFFLFTRNELRFCRFTFSAKEIGSACYNGSSEMVSQLSNAVITFLLNIVMMSLAGENGVAAITILLYGQFLFNAVYMGFSIGISPIIGFQYGAGNRQKLRNIYKIAFLFVIVSSVLVVAVAVIFSPAIVTIFTKEQRTWELASVGFRIFAINFLFSGINITSSGFFTALSNGKVSALISFSRTLVFIVISLLILPRIFHITGAWLAILVAEFLTMIISGLMHRKYFWLAGEKNYL
jgi:putative MATE family efflux protein